jgi:hypothetical protein
MDGVREFLDDLKRHGHAGENLLGLLNVVIGRRIEKADGTLLSAGVTWRELARVLKRVRWDKDDVRQLGLDPANLPPRNREHYWYTAIAQAAVASPTATQAGDRLAAALKPAGYVIGSAPGQGA